MIIFVFFPKRSTVYCWEYDELKYFQINGYQTIVSNYENNSNKLTKQPINEPAKLSVVFINEERLLYYKYYTRRNCESECQSIYLYRKCSCIPYNFPLIYSNASICSVKESFCISKANKEWILVSPESLCLKRCLPGCFDLNFLPDSFSGPLAERNYLVQF